MSTITAAAPRTDRRLRAAAVLAAVAVPVLIWSLAVPVFDVDLRVVDQRSDRVVEVGLGAVVFMSAVASLLGWALLAVLERFTARARTIWTVAAVAVLVLSFAPLLSPDLAGSTRLVLGLMHLGVGTVLIPAMIRSSSPQPPAVADAP